MAKSKQTKVTVERPSSTKTQTKAVAAKSTESSSLKERLQTDLSKNQSYLNYVLGALIVLIIGILLFNYFNKPNNLGPSQQADQQNENQQEQQGDVTKETLPGKYTIKEGDTLFLIAQQYYNDGFKYTEIIKENKLANPDVLEVGQEITIPKIEGEQASNNENQAADESPAPDNQTDNGQGGAENMTIWGNRITGETYTVQAGDWLSKIAERAYGDINQFSKIAEANNITNPEVIEVGTVLKIPR